MSTGPPLALVLREVLSAATQRNVPLSGAGNDRLNFGEKRTTNERCRAPKVLVAIVQTPESATSHSTELQVYGNTAIIYPTYLCELENAKGERQVSTGRATEINRLVNGSTCTDVPG